MLEHRCPGSRTFAAHVRRALSAVSVIAFGVLAGCRDSAPVEPPVAGLPGLRRASLPSDAAPVRPGDASEVDALARALARALADSALRQRVLSDLRDSPFGGHALHLASYLGGPAGAPLRDAAGRHGMPPERLLAATRVRGGLQLSLPIPADRLFWTGTADVAVEGTAFTLEERLRAPAAEVAYTITGEPRQSGVLVSLPLRRLSITPATRTFGSDPEATRRAAPHQSRRTVSTPSEEMELVWQRGHARTRASAGPTTSTAAAGPTDVQPFGCSTTNPLMPCIPEDEGTGGTGGTALPSGKPWSACVGSFSAAADRDRDSVDDGCEYELAYTFRPRLVLMSNDCNTQREPYYSVRYQNNGFSGPVVAIFYALGYSTDCGSPRLDCPYACEGHPGDSEFIIVYVGPAPGYENAARWYLNHATLSAHWRSLVNETATYGEAALTYYGTARVRPYVWVAEDKHANYRSKSVCDAGANYYDNCDSPLPVTSPGQNVEVLTSANLGQWFAPFIGGPGSPVYSRLGMPGVEYFWDPSRPFVGWNHRTGAAASSPYYESLRAFDF